MMASVNEEIESRLTRHQIDLQRLSKGTVTRVLSALKKSDSRIVQRLIKDDVSQLSRTRMEALLRDLRRIIDNSYVDATGVLQIELNALAKYEGEFIEDMFGKVIPVKLETVTPSPEQIVAAVNNRPFQGKLLKEVYQELPASTFRKVRDTIRAGFIEGRTTDQIVRDIRGRASQGYKDGILAKSKRDVETVVRTAVNHTSNAAREYTYEANDDLIKGVRWISTLDSRTSPVCQARDGKIYEPGKGPRPPAHFNCRSTTSPVLKSWQELGFDVDEVPESTRASMNGQVPAGQDYDTWLRKQPRDFQDDVLGKTKADMFRRGTKLDRFVDASGREYTLDELRQREGVKPRAQKIPSFMSAEDKTHFDRVLERGRKSKIEHLSAYDPTTGKQWTLAGKENSVSIPDTMLREMMKGEPRLVVHHNHPSSRSFSPQDFNMIGQSRGMKTLYAHGHDGSVFRADGIKPFGRQTLDKANNAVARPFIDAESEFSSPEDRMTLFHHVYSIWMDKKGYVSYKYELRGSVKSAYENNKALIDSIVESF